MCCVALLSDIEPRPTDELIARHSANGWLHECNQIVYLLVPFPLCDSLYRLSLQTNRASNLPDKQINVVANVCLHPFCVHPKLVHSNSSSLTVSHSVTSDNYAPVKSISRCTCMHSNTNFSLLFTLSTLHMASKKKPASCRHQYRPSKSR